MQAPKDRATGLPIAQSEAVGACDQGRGAAVDIKMERQLRQGQVFVGDSAAVSA